MSKSTIIISNNYYLITGLKNLDCANEFGEIHCCSGSINSVNDIEKYDFIFIEIASHQTRLCLSNLIKRKGGGYIFFIQTGLSPLLRDNFLACFKDATVLDKNTPLDQTIKIVRETILSKNKTVGNNLVDYCLRCRYPYLSETQLLILIGYKYGYKVREISQALNVSEKTIYAQIYKIKGDFNLRGSFDMFSFLKNDLKCYQPIVINNVL